MSARLPLWFFLACLASACGVKAPPVAPQQHLYGPPPKIDCSPTDPDCDKTDPHYVPIQR